MPRWRRPISLHVVPAAVGVRGIEDTNFYTEKNRDGKHVGRAREFPNLRTKPHVSRLDAVDEIISLVTDKLREIHERMAQR